LLSNKDSGGQMPHSKLATNKSHQMGTGRGFSILHFQGNWKLMGVTKSPVSGKPRGDKDAPKTATHDIAHRNYNFDIHADSAL
jgi:hypothetical protein